MRTGSFHARDTPVVDDFDVGRVEHSCQRTSTAFRPALQTDSQQVGAPTTAGELPHAGADVTTLDLFCLLHREQTSCVGHIGTIGEDLLLSGKRQCGKVVQRRPEAGDPSGSRIDRRNALDHGHELRWRQRLTAERGGGRSAIHSRLLQQGNEVLGNVPLRVELDPPVFEHIECVMESRGTRRPCRLCNHPTSRALGDHPCLHSG